MASTPTRGLGPEFLTSLQGGLLSAVAERVRSDQSLCLEIREDSVNVYYRGGSLMRIARSGGAYKASFDAHYFAGSSGPSAAPEPALSQSAHVDAWIAAFPRLKEAMDLKAPGREREIQQAILRDNNFGAGARSTDYYVCDIEYATAHGRFDIVAVRWPSTPAARKRADGHRLVFAEVKQGDGALDGPAGLHAHVRDVNQHLADPARVTAIQREMVTVFNQKRALGLVECGKDLGGFGDERPLLLLMLANHDPDKSRLRELLTTLPDSPHVDVRIATSSLMGYGLYNPGVLTLDEAMARFDDCI